MILTGFEKVIEKQNMFTILVFKKGNVIAVVV